MTVGYGDISPQNSDEIMFSSIVVLLGCFIFAFNMNSIGIIMQEKKKDETLYR